MRAVSAFSARGASTVDGTPRALMFSSYLREDHGDVLPDADAHRCQAARFRADLDYTTILLYSKSMPATDVIYFQELDGSVPVLDWLTEIARRDRRAVEKCAARIDALRQQGHELRRPMADYLRDGIYELRIRSGRVQYRVLYFFHGQNAVVLAHGLVKERAVPDADIERAILRLKEFKRAPARHSFREETSNG